VRQSTHYAHGRPWIPRADIYETKESVTIVLDLPGVNAEQIDVQCENGLLSIKGERSFTGNDSERQYHRVENMYGTFERYFEIPKTVDSQNVEAIYKDGVLSVVLPKIQKAAPQKITIHFN